MCDLEHGIGKGIIVVVRFLNYTLRYPPVHAFQVPVLAGILHFSKPLHHKRGFLLADCLLDRRILAEHTDQHPRSTLAIK